MTLAVGRVASVRVGRVATLARPAWDRAASRTWRSAYVKDEASGPVRITRTHLEGDEQFDRENHGGPQMAVLAYAAAHYPAWQAELGIPGFGPGAFGENVVVEGFDEVSTCVGDVFAVGGAVLEVSQPRGPCANISRRWDRAELLARVVATRRTGWYLRVLEEGEVAAGDAVTLERRPHPDFDIASVLHARQHPADDADLVVALSACEALSPEWRAKFANKARAIGR